MCPPTKSTFCHYAEYLYVNELLDTVKAHPDYNALVSRLSRIHEGYSCQWPFTFSTWVQDRLQIMGAVAFTRLGNAHMACYSAKDFVDNILDALHNEQWKILERDDKPNFVNTWKDWLADCRQMQQDLTQ